MQEWSIDLTISSGTSTHWIYRRDNSIRCTWDRAVLRTREGVPYLAPEIQLLFKSKDPRSKDHEDAEVVFPTLDEAQRAFLASHLTPGHPWLLRMV
jgi:hypothetical protein